MTTRNPIPLGPAGDPDARAAENDLRAVHVTAAVRLWHRVGITAHTATYHPTYGPDTSVLDGHLRVEVQQRSAGGLEIVVDNPDAADDLAAALTWAATRLREQLTDVEPATDRRAFGLAEPPYRASTREDTTAPAATKEAA
jgi:hypothetical protein